MRVVLSISKFETNLGICTQDSVDGIMNFVSKGIQEEQFDHERDKKRILHLFLKDSYSSFFTHFNETY